MNERFDPEAYADYFEELADARKDAEADAEDEHERTHAPEEPAWMTEPDYNEEN